MPIAAQSEGARPASAIASPIAPCTETSQVAGSCSDQPDRGWATVVGRAPRPMIAPPSSRRTAFVDWVPTSQPMTKMAGLLGRVV